MNQSPASTCIGFLLAAMAPQAHGQGGAAVVALVIPPPAGEGYSILQSGGPFADGPASLYYNPALLADLERQTGSRLHYTTSAQTLATAETGTEFQAMSLATPGLEEGHDVGVGFFRNRLEMGAIPKVDPEGKVVGVFEPREDVYGAGMGIRLGLPVSLGATAKYFESRLFDGAAAGGHGGDGTARSWALDMGVLANPRLCPAPGRYRGPWFEVMPSASLALRNLGPDV